MKFLIIFVLLAVGSGTVCFCGAAPVPRMKCNARNDGKFWPEEANYNSVVARQLFQQGDLEMCTLVVWKYRWEHLSVNARRLASNRMHQSRSAQTLSNKSVDETSVASRLPARNEGPQ